MIESELKETLQKLQQAIADADGEGIKEGIAQVDSSLKEHRLEIDARLRHFLKNRSYMKALAYLNGETDIPTGRCSGRTDFS